MNLAMANEKIPINPAILRWAREDAGLSPEEAAERARLKPLKRTQDGQERSPADRLLAWEKGEDAPSLRQLEGVAKAYQRPLITFFLTAPPIKQTILADFRTTSGRGGRIHDTPEFAALKRRIEALHEELKEIAAEEQYPELGFIGSVSVETPIPVIVEMIRKGLRFDYAEQEQLSNKEKLINMLRKKAHDAGVFVLFEGNLGSYHTSIHPEEFRGLAFVDKRAPLIVINPNDAKAAQIFTFLHEVTHLCLGTSGVSNINALSASTRYEHALTSEKICDMVAAEFLVPEVAVKREIGEEKNNSLEQINNLAVRFNVSRAVIARRLFDMSLIKEVEYWGLIRAFKVDWENSKLRQKNAEGGPSRNILDKHRLGDKLIHTIIGAAVDGKMALQDAARLLHIPVSRFDKVS